jgi:hypothetical protein
MVSSFWRLFVLAFFLLAPSGCVTTSAPFLKVVKSEGVDQIPLKLGVYPFLSTATSGASHYGTLGTLDSSLRLTHDSVAIVPPTNSTLLVTQDSQLLTDQFTTALAGHKFSLKQFPVELVQEKDGGKNDPKGFYLSLGLLREMKEKYGTEAVVMGNVIVVNGSYMQGYEKKVQAVHVKVVKIESLDVLAQVNLPYRQDGYEFNATAEELAAALARLAGRDVPVK